MKTVVQTIDRAIKQLYNLDSPHRAENFLIDPNSPKLRTMPPVTPSERAGAVIIKISKEEEGNVDLGIVFGEKVQAGLSQIECVEPSQWLGLQMNALSVATEEISHFHYLVERFQLEQTVTQLELELQGEIDKFLLIFFLTQPASRETPNLFETIFDQIFSHFHWMKGLSVEKQQRYEQANTQARLFIKNFGESVWNRKSPDQCLEYLRHFYRLSQSEKLGFISCL